MMPFHRVIPLDAEFIGTQKDAISQLLVLRPLTKRNEVTRVKGLTAHKNYDLLEPLTENSPLVRTTHPPFSRRENVVAKDLRSFPPHL
jgi:hypothetical protein